MNTRSKNQITAMRAAQRKRPTRIISLILSLSLISGNLTGFFSAAAELNHFCGKEAHTHTEECYRVYNTPDPTVTEETVVVEETVLETVPNETAESVEATTETVVETTAEAVVETTGEAVPEPAYTISETPVCGKEEHTHVVQCYSDPSADVETAEQWEATLPKNLSGIWSEDLLATVSSQLGYQESASNYIVEEDESLSGYNRYGAWYSSFTQDANQAYLPWNITFLFFSIYYSQITDLPLEETCPEWIAALNSCELYRAAGEYTPAEGDLVFVDTDGDGEADRVGVASEVKDNKLIAIEGDYEGAVAEVTYALPELTVEPETTETEGTTEIDVSVSQSSVMLLSDGTEEGDEAPQPTVVGYADMAQAQADAQPEGDAATLNNTTFTIYFAAPQSWTSYTIKANVCRSNSENNWQTVDMTNTGDTWVFNGTTYYVYSAQVTEIYGGFDKIQFQRYSGNAWQQNYEANSSWVTKETIDSKIYVNGSGWEAYNSGGGSGTTVTVVDIDDTEAFSPADDTYYVNASFYDYYTDYELDGNNRDSDTSGMDKDNDWVVFRNFNTALSNYYSSNSVKIPLYVGHFQPEWGGWKYPFVNEGLSLYGFKDGDAYGTTSTDQKYFMSVNNSHMDSADSITSYLYSYAAQGLVNNALVNDSLMSVNKSGGTAALPMFNAAFINGTNSLSKKLGDVYENVSFPFTKKDVNNNGVEYWYFDSAATTLEMKKDSASDDYFLKAHSSLQGWAKNVDSSSIDQGTYGFFPFNSGSTSCVANSYNYGFGCRLDIPFRLTSNGKVKTSSGSETDIIFEFSGDDDVWVFIDGQLVLDIGGSHGKVKGNINFASKNAWVENTKINPGTNNTGSNESKTYNFNHILPDENNTDEHTLTMFYMERGMWESNMKITFNFPDENQLEVEKDVDTTKVNPLFTSAFQNQKLFTFKIMNQATHFEEVQAKGNETKPIKVDIAQSEVKSYSGNTFEKGTYQGQNDALHWYAQLNDTSSAYRNKRYGVLTLPSAVDITNMTKLSFYMYYDSSSGFSLSDLYLQILDKDVQTNDLLGNSNTAGDTYSLGCNSTSLSGKTYGTISTSGKKWVKVTVDLSKLNRGSSFNETEVKYIRFGCNYPVNIYIYGLTFEPAASVSEPTGFVTQQYEIASYGSAGTGELMNADGAVYSSANSKAKAFYMVGEDGTFVLEDGEVVNFHDQFRRGSYIYLEEVMNDQEKELYDTTWTMYENDWAVTSMADDDVVNIANPANDMTDVPAYTVTDGRTEVVTEGDVNGYEQKNAYTNESNPGGFVFRSYSDPDSTATTTKLRVKFTNKVKTGSLTISKKDANAGKETGTIGSGEQFTFYVVFTNVGGMSLESAPIVAGPIPLSVGHSVTISGIPINTEYAVYEIKSDNANITLDHITDDVYEKYPYEVTTYTVNTTVGTEKKVAYMAKGVIDDTSNNETGNEETSNDEPSNNVTYYNIQKEVVSLKLTKLWEGLADGEEPPMSIKVQLQCSTDGTNWSQYNDYYAAKDIGPGYESWNGYTFEFTNLDKYVSGTTTEYKYRVVELDSEGKEIESNDETTGVLELTDGTKYEVTYGTVEKAEDGEGNEIDNQFTQTITNTVKPKAKVTVTKAWNVPTDVTKPESVTVQLQRRTGINDFAAIDGLDNVTLSATNEWTHTFEGLDEMDSNNVAYDYRVVELNGNTAMGKDDTFTVTTGEDENAVTVEYRVTYGEVANAKDGEGKAIANEYTQTITNSAVPEVTLQITKLDATDTTKKLDGVVFKLEKKDDNTFTAMEVTTGTDGIASFAGLKAGTYTLTETKAKSGYSLLKSSITIEITESVAENGAIRYTAKVDGTDVADTEFTQTGNVYTLAKTIYNKPSLTMPATGGVNGFEFWILGGLCMMAVPLLLYTFFWFKKGGKYLQK